MKKYKEEICVFVVFFAFIFVGICTKYLNSLDEIWVFNTARNVANGLLPYKDFNLITTPGIPITCGFFLKIFGTELFVMRILCCFLGATIFMVIYKVLKTLDINKYINLFILLLYYVFVINYIAVDYNFVNLLISLIIFYFELKLYKETKELFIYNFKRDFFLGVLAGISIVFKQTTGILLTIGVILYKLLAIKNKTDLKKFIKIAITRLAGSLLPLIIMIIYLLKNNLIEDFTNYAILGIKEFSNMISYMDFLLRNIGTGLLAIIVPVIITILFYESVIKKNKLEMILFSFSIVTFMRHISNCRYNTFYYIRNNCFNFRNIFSE